MRLRGVSLAAGFFVACAASPPRPSGGAESPSVLRESSLIPAIPASSGGAELPVPTPISIPTQPLNTPPPPVESPWVWPLPNNYGVRVDKGGKGWFRAGRGDRIHHGLDLLSPLGTTAVALCTGKFRVGKKDPYGVWVQVVCPLPDMLVDKQPVFVSILYAHMTRLGMEPREFVDVQRGEPIGYVGKTGNASDPKIQPHLHLEIVVHNSEANAMAEEHPVKEPRTLATASMEADVYTEAQLKIRCLDATSLRPSDGVFRRDRRSDPFLMLSCLADRPATEAASSPLNKAERSFSERYGSSTDVDSSQKALILK